MRSPHHRGMAQLTTASRFAYHHGMPGGQVYWTLVFTAANLEHLAERNVEAADVTNAVYGEHGTVWRSSQQISKISTSLSAPRARSRSRYVSTRMTWISFDLLRPSTASDIPRWREQSLKDG